VKSLIEFRVPVQVPKYDFVTHSYSSYTHIKPSDVIILEGIFSLYNENVRNLASIKIFVDVPDDERLIRRILRDVKERNTDIVQTVKM
jgi:uridine kinase